MNITLKEKDKSMLSDAGLSQDYSVKEVARTSYVLDRSSTLALVKKTPYEAWDGKRTFLVHLKVFGCELWTFQKKEGINLTTS